MKKYQTEFRLLSLKGIAWKQRRDVHTSKKRLQALKIITLQSFTICLDMELFVLVPASVYNKNNSLNTQEVRGLEVPKYGAQLNPKSHTDLPKK